jgi:Transglutaminase-like superfamily
MAAETVLDKQAGLRIAPHVRACETEDGIVLLDLKRNDYIGLDRTESQLLSFALWKNGSQDDLDTSNTASTHERSQHLRRLTEELVSKGLLAVSASHIDCRTTKLLATIEDELRGGRESVGPRPDLKNWFRMTYSCAWAAAVLHLRSLEDVAKSIAEQKKRLTTRSVASERSDVRAHMQAFSWMRPFFYSDKGRCLYDSVVLMHFMIRLQVSPTLVIGVQSRPFRAHAWVQWDRYLMSGLPTYVSEFVPILVV